MLSPYTNVKVVEFRRGGGGKEKKPTAWEHHGKNKNKKLRKKTDLLGTSR